MTLPLLLERAARVLPGHVAVRLGTRDVLDYRELAARAARLGAGLVRRHGLRPGDRVVLALRNEPAYLEALFACWAARLIAVPVNAHLHARELAVVLDDCSAGVVLTSPELAGVLAEAVAHSARRPDMVVSGGTDWARLLDRDERPGTGRGRPDDPAWLFYTSGTTGTPKGAVLSHRNLLTMTAAYLSDVDPTGPGDAIIHAAPLSHGSGLYVLPHVAAMATHVIPESGGFDPAELVGLLARTPGASLFAAPTMVHRLVRAPEIGALDPGNLRSLVYGGGPMYVADCSAALDALGPRLVQIYGQGESPMTITVLPTRVLADVDDPRREQRLAGVGFAQWPVEVVVAGSDDLPLPPGEIGEVLVRGDTVMAGYWNRPEASAETLRGGWLHTGDLGELDEDGFLTLRDRSKDVIISGGSNIYPREIEEVLLRDPRVEEIAVVGRPDPDWGEEVVAFVVGSDVDAAELDRLCLASIA
ncbi:MAG: AMP-dependent synthetase, partial [Frankiales bacterium]|nr:AMP-dependent synthetase [Frankiales bacterium]